jgi:ubiquinone/menaquinone biosynthesis C-methylase UbiE
VTQVFHSTQAASSREVEAMRLGTIEFLAMNNPIRRWIQKHFELNLFKRHLERHHIDLRAKVIVDAGCGSGYSSELLARTFEPAQLFAFDLMPEQIHLARKRGLDINFKVGDMTAMELRDETADAVFIFGVLHHIPHWEKALGEVARVLKPAGVLLVEEPQERFRWPEFEAGMTRAGFEILENCSLLSGYFKSFLGQKPT